MNERAIESLPESRLRLSLVEKISSESKPSVDDNYDKGKQPKESALMAKEQCKQENSKQEKKKNQNMTQMSGTLLFIGIKNLGSPRDTPPSNTYQNQ